jgi:formylglycine-generating enzyme required for sulfatase activity
MYMKFVRLSLIMLGTLILSTLGIGAADTWLGNSDSLLGQLVGVRMPTRCEVGMTDIPTATTFSCADTFEVSAGSECPYLTPTSGLESGSNIAVQNCQAVSLPKVTPWRFITREEAMIVCARAGKRLPTAAEWYEAALGTPEAYCNTGSGNVAVTASFDNCISATGITDAVGNLWEWVSDDSIDGEYGSRTLPPSGYVTQVDNGGVATETNPEQSALQFGADYFWSTQQQAAGLIRGGFYSGKTDAGIFSVQAETKPTFAGAAVGFRCVK